MALVSWDRWRSAKTQLKDHTVSLEGSPIWKRYLATSARMQENCAPVSTRVGTLPVLNSNATHNKGSRVPAATLFTPLKMCARGRSPSGRLPVSRWPSPTGAVTSNVTSVITVPTFQRLSGPRGSRTGSTPCTTPTGTSGLQSLPLLRYGQLFLHNSYSYLSIYERGVI